MWTQHYWHWMWQTDWTSRQRLQAQGLHQSPLGSEDGGSWPTRGRPCICPCLLSHTTRALVPHLPPSSQVQPQRHWGSMTSMEQSRQVERLSFNEEAYKECPLSNGDNARCHRQTQVEGDGPYALKIHHVDGGGKTYTWRVSFRHQSSRHRIMLQGMGSHGTFSALHCLSVTHTKMPQASHFEISAPGQWANTSGLIQPSLGVDEPQFPRRTPFSSSAPRLPSSDTTAWALGTALMCSPNT